MTRTQSVTLAVHAVIALALIGAASALAWHGTIDAQAVTSIFGTVIGLVGGSAGTLAVVGFQQASIRAAAVEARRVDKGSA